MPQSRPHLSFDATEASRSNRAGAARWPGTERAAGKCTPTCRGSNGADRPPDRPRWPRAVCGDQAQARRRVLLVHGAADRRTSPAGSAHFAERLRSAGVSASFVEIGGEGHAMMRRPRLWHQLAAGFLPGTLIPERDPSHTDQEPDFLRQAVRGEAHITL